MNFLKLSYFPTLVESFFLSTILITERTSRRNLPTSLIFEEVIKGINDQRSQCIHSVRLESENILLKSINYSIISKHMVNLEILTSEKTFDPFK